ncbi:MAG: LysR family transcriptional regulator [Gammaproteobacteria bacterium]|nr:LysR family transcriptional regulator [Gammaproteobacteria bacterium]
MERIIFVKFIIFILLINFIDMRFSLRQLEVFVAISRYDNVSRAAEALSLSQSATSMALIELEKQFNTHLFDRASKRLQLNELGHLLLPKAIELLDRTRDIESLLAGDAGFGPLRIGASLTIGNYLATLLIGNFMQQHPSCHVHLDVANSATIIQRVAHFDLDLGLIESDCQHHDLEVIPWVADELMIFAAPEHPLAQQSEISLSDLVSAKWIVRETGSGTRQTFDHAMRSVLSQLNILLELEHTEAIKRAVESGLGISCISRLALKDAFRRGSLVPLTVPGLDFGRHFHFLLHKQKFRTHGMQEFLALCQKVSVNVRYSDEIVLPRPA